MHLTLIAGARPNFMKLASLVRSLDQARDSGRDVEYRIVHTGQHYDQNLSDRFFQQLGLPEPDVNLGVGSGTHAEQTARIMVEFEKDLKANPTDMVIVVGDVNSTLACSVVAKKQHTLLAHVEAGIRSFDLTMPEEINRMVTDSLTDHFFTTSEFADQNLRNAGVDNSRIHFVGNTMIDTLLGNMDRFQKPGIWDELGLETGKYFVMTLHRPSSVDGEEVFARIITAIRESAAGWNVVFPVHPRTMGTMKSLDLNVEGIHCIDPLGYLEFNYLVKHARGVITDSGGITEETTIMNVPCITIRENTERPETITMGTNELAGTDPIRIQDAISRMIAGDWKKGSVPPLWDGNAGERIVAALLDDIFAVN